MANWPADLAVLTFSGVAFAGEAAHPSDLIASRLNASSETPAKTTALPGMVLSRESVQFSWNLDTSAAIAAPTPHRAESREFYMDVDAATLRRGVAINTTARGSVVKLSPSGLNADTNAKSKAKSLTIDDVIVRVDGKSVGLRSFASRVDDSAKLGAWGDDAGVSFAPGSLAFLIDDARGAATFEVALKSADRSYLVHVFEPASPNALTLTTNRDAYLVGEQLEISAAATNGAAITEISGGIASPQGDIKAVTFTRHADGHFVGNIALSEGTAGALYEAFAVAKLSDGSLIALRDAKVSFAVAEPVARLINIAANANNLDTASFSVDVEVATAGRYQAEAVLYAQQGSARVPVAIAHSGAWLNAGESTMSLKFDNLDLAKRGIAGPFTLGHFALKNQGTLSTVERRAEIAVTTAPNVTTRLRGDRKLE